MARLSAEVLILAGKVRRINNAINNRQTPWRAIHGLVPP
jgi:hypothetical protein